MNDFDLGWFGTQIAKYITLAPQHLGSRALVSSQNPYEIQGQREDKTARQVTKPSKPSKPTDATVNLTPELSTFIMRVPTRPHFGRRCVKCCELLAVSRSNRQWNAAKLHPNPLKLRNPAGSCCFCQEHLKLQTALLNHIAPPHGAEGSTAQPQNVPILNTSNLKAGFPFPKPSWGAMASAYFSLGKGKPVQADRQGLSLRRVKLEKYDNTVVLVPVCDRHSEMQK